MPRFRRNLCHRVPPRATSRARDSLHPPAKAPLLGAVLAVLACADPITPRPLPAAPRGDEPSLPSAAGVGAPSGPNRDVSSPGPPLPPSCLAVGCLGGFTVQFEREGPWPADTYFFRVSLDDGPRQVCSVVFEPVIGASRDTCNEAGLPFTVSYQYDDYAQQIYALEFGEVRRVHVTLLTAEDEPPLADVEHDVDFRYPSSTGSSCQVSCERPPPLVVEVARAAVLGGDAGNLSDAGDPSDAGSGPRDAGAPDATP